MRVLNEAQAWAIHHAALEILENTGFVMNHPQVQQMLLDAGCRIDSDGRTLMPARLAEDAIQSAPPPNHALRPAGQSLYAAGGR